ncbi:MAG: ATPase, T2SS/T4P/T4SS family [Candidatus Asgardarchaeia archaeon]
MKVSLKGEECSGEVLDRYDVGCYRVYVVRRKNLTPLVYIPMERMPQDPDYLKKVIVKYMREELIRDIPLQERYDMERIEVEMKDRIRSIIEKKGLMIDSRDEGIIDYLFFNLLGLSDMHPFFIDDKINEFYMDAPNSLVYLDHNFWGRCITPVKVKNRTLERLKTLISIVSGKSLDMKNPSVKNELLTSRFHVRVSIDIPPLVSDGTCVDVRKLKVKPFTIVDLIKNGTISLDAAAFIHFSLLRKVNIVVLGKPGSGKTTLANAIDLMTPPHWRKVYLEETVESIPQRDFGRLQLRIREIEGKGVYKSYRKDIEVVKLLHRNPDWIFFGEVLTGRHSKALFHALNSGLSGIQTFHSSSALNAISRWRFNHGINYSSMSNLGIMITMRKIMMGGRYVFRVYEISEVLKSELIDEPPLIVSLFKWNPKDDSLVMVREFRDSGIVNSIVSSEGKTYEEAEEEVESYRENLRAILSRQNISVVDFLRSMDEFYSKKVYNGDLYKERIFME